MIAFNKIFLCFALLSISLPLLASTERADIRIENRKKAIKSLRAALKMSPEKEEQPEVLLHLANQFKDLVEAYRFRSESLLDQVNPDLKEAEKERLIEKITKEQKDIEKDIEENLKKAFKIYNIITSRYGLGELVEEAYLAMADLHKKENEAKKAAQIYEAFLEKFPKSKYLGTVWLYLGEYHFNDGNILAAENAYKKTIKFDKGSARSYAIYKFGWCKYNLNEFEKARKIFSKVLSKYLDLIGEKDKNVFLKQVIDDYNLTLSRSMLGSEASERILAEIPSKYRNQTLISLGKLFLSQGKNEDAVIVLGNVEKESISDLEKISLLQTELAAATKMKVFRIFKSRNQELKSILRKINPETLKKQKKLVASFKTWAATHHKLWIKGGQKVDLNFAMSSYSTFIEFFDFDKSYLKMTLLGSNLAYKSASLDQAFSWYTIAQQPRFKDYKNYEKSFYQAYIVAQTKCQNQGILDKNGNLKPTAEFNDETKCLNEMFDTARRFKTEIEKSNLQNNLFYSNALLLYSLNKNKQALDFFETVTLRFAASENGRLSADNILKFYEEKKDYDSLKTYGLKFLANKELAVEPYKSKWVSVVEGVALVAIEKSKEKASPEKVAEDYLNFALGLPNSKHASTALINASFYFGKAGMPGQSIEAKALFLSRFPDHEEEKNILWDLAKSYQKAHQFEEMPSVLEKIYLKFDDENALGQKCRTLLLLNLSNEAEKCLNKAINRIKNIEILKSLALSLKTFSADTSYSGFWTKAAAVFKRKAPEFSALAYLKLYPSISYNRVKNKIKGLKLAENKKIFYTESLLLKKADVEQKELENIELSLPQRKIARSIRKIAAKLAKISKDLAPLISSSNKQTVLKSSMLLAKLYKTVSEKILSAPEPENISADELVEYKSFLGEQALPLEEMSLKFLTALSSLTNVYQNGLSELRFLKKQINPEDKSIIIPYNWEATLLDFSNSEIFPTNEFDESDIKKELGIDSLKESPKS